MGCIPSAPAITQAPRRLGPRGRARQKKQVWGIACEEVSQRDPTLTLRRFKTVKWRHLRSGTNQIKYADRHIQVLMTLDIPPRAFVGVLSGETVTWTCQWEESNAPAAMEVDRMETSWPSNGRLSYVSNE